MYSIYYSTYCSPEVLFETFVAMKFVDDDDSWAEPLKKPLMTVTPGQFSQSSHNPRQIHQTISLHNSAGHIPRNYPFTSWTTTSGLIAPQYSHLMWRLHNSFKCNK